MGITVTPVSDALGAEITGVDLSRDLDADTVSSIEEAWHQHIVLIFRDQDLEPEHQIRLAEHLGGTEDRGLPQDRTPEGQRADRRVALVTNKLMEGDTAEHMNDGEFWFHHDGCFNEKPYKGTILFGVEIPSSGGDTLFTNNYMAYDRLSDGMKQRLKGMRSLQVYDFAMRERVDPNRDLTNIRHYRPPVCMTHPVTGRKALYVNPLMTVRIEGLPEDESEALLAELCRYTEDPELVFEHLWRPGDLVLFDNWCSAHFRTDFPPEQTRLLRRSMVAGQRLEE